MNTLHRKTPFLIVAAGILLIVAALVVACTPTAPTPMPTALSTVEPTVTGHPAVPTVASLQLPTLPFSPIKLPLGQPGVIIPSGQRLFAGATYVGSQECKTCHATQYESWQKTWHSRMARLVSPNIVVTDFNNVTLNLKDISAETPDGKSTQLINVTVQLATKDGQFFVILVDQDNPANNQTYQVAEVLGGNWEQMYEIKLNLDGVVQTYPSPIRWSVTDQSWLAQGFRADEWFFADGTPDGIPRRPAQLKKGRATESKCRMCHETGYVPTYKADIKRWTGESLELGIACERCHGPGSLHVKLNGDPTKIVHPLKDLTTLQQDELCAQCHGRQTNKTQSDLAFQLGFFPGDVDMATRVTFWGYNDPDPQKNMYFWPSDWAKRNRQQWQDFTKSKHFWKTDVTCLTCHTFHGDWSPRQLRLPANQLCVNCHNAQGYAARPNFELYSNSPMAQAGVTCVDCHMPKLGFRTEPTFAKPYDHWDVTSHTFMVSKPQYALEYGQRSSCAQCHSAGGSSTLVIDNAQQDAVLKTRQAEIRLLLDQVTASQAQARRLLQTVKPDQVSALQPKFDTASARLDLILRDGSLGFHNFQQSKDWLNQANALFTEIITTLGSTAPTPSP